MAGQCVDLSEASGLCTNFHSLLGMVATWEAIEVSHPNHSVVVHLNSSGCIAGGTFEQHVARLGRLDHMDYWCGSRLVQKSSLSNHVIRSAHVHFHVGLSLRNDQDDRCLTRSRLHLSLNPDSYGAVHSGSVAEHMELHGRWMMFETVDYKTYAATIEFVR